MLRYSHERAVGFLIFILASASVVAAHAAGWELVFSDEFNDDRLDRTKWATRYIYENETLDRFKDEKQRYRDNDNHVLSDGVLSLIARKKPGGDYFESGLIRSHRTFYYGYYEARIFLPNARGVWPAFWLEGDYDVDGKFWHPPEIDIFEYVINGVEDKANMLHSNSASRDKWAEQQYIYHDRSFWLRLQEMVANEDLNKDWHVVGFVWAPDRISLFWDGRLIYTRMFQWLRKDGELGPPAHIDLNLAIGGGWAGRHGIDESSFPQSFKIDYVRVCQYTTSEQGDRQCGPSTMTPAPADFGYSAPLNDMPKPAFLGIDGLAAGGKETAKTLKRSAGEPLIFRLPVRLPKNYPTNRQLEVSVFDEVTGAVVASTITSFHDNMKTETDGNGIIEVSLPSIRTPGNYIIAAKLTTELTSGNGSKEKSISPVACQTEILQPPKGRSCRLSRLKIQ